MARSVHLFAAAVIVAALIPRTNGQVPAQSAPSSPPPRVFITDSQSWEVVGSAAGSQGTFAASTRGGARPQTAEIIKTFGERCQQVLVNNKQEKADYIVVLDHEGGKGYLRRRNKVAVFNKDGDAIVSRSTRSLGNSVQAACVAIVADWSGHHAASTSQSQPNSESQAPAGNRGLPLAAAPVVPKNTAPISPPAAMTTSSSLIGATLEIASSPPGADIEIDGSFSGSTPSPVGVVAGEHTVRISKKGYTPWERKIRSSTGNIRITAELEPSPIPTASSASSAAASTTPMSQGTAPVSENGPTTSAPATSPGPSLRPAVMTSTAPQSSPATAPRQEMSAANSPGPAPVAEGEGTASITSDPTGAEIFIDSAGRGRAPMLLKLRQGKHKIQLVVDGYKDWVADIEVKGGSIVNVTAKLEK